MANAHLHDHHRATPSLLRSRGQGEHSRVTTFELFFDLVFVFAVTQLSHFLVGHLTFEGASQGLLMVFAVWWAWMYTAWATNWLDPEHLTVRLMLVAVMLGGIIMSAAVPEAFGAHGLAFAASYVAIQAGRSAFVLWVVRAEPPLQRTFRRITAWFVVSGCIWIAGAFLEGDARFAAWAVALTIDYFGPPTGYWLPRFGKTATTDWSVEGSHMAERCGLFIIIALGESLLVTGATFSGLEWTGRTIAAMLAAVAGTVALWWIYFDLTAEAGSEQIAHTDDPGRIARSAYTYFHLPMVAGIIVAAVGDESVLLHPSGETSFRVGLTIAGGPMLFLAGHALFRRVISREWPLPHFVGLAALAAILGASVLASPLAVTIAVSVVLVAMAPTGRRADRAILDQPG